MTSEYDGSEDPSEHTNERTERTTAPITEVKQVVHERDRYTCANCRATQGHTELLELDMDHNVPRGAGGSEQITNLITLCRTCHDAKHGDGIAPTVQIQSTGTMRDVEFMWFKHLVDDLLPAMAETFGVRLNPKFDLAGESAWHLPLGDVRKLSERVSQDVDGYRSMMADEFM